MTRVLVFAGPSLTPADRRTAPQIAFRPPVARDDILRSLATRPAAIGIVDGWFGDRPSVLHKEILEAIAEGVPVHGAASMGALRAAELHPFGMVGHGEVFRLYRDGVLVSDADVAVAHGPEELGYPLLSLAQVDVRATLASLAARGRLSASGAAAVEAASAALFYARRTWSAIAEAAGEAGVQAGPGGEPLAAVLARAHVQLKRLDAIALVRHLCGPRDFAQDLPARPVRPPRTPQFLRRLAAAGREA